MAASNRIEVVEGVGYYRLPGNRGFQQAVKAIREAIVKAREDGLRALLVDILEVRFEPHGVAERHVMVRTWAEAAQDMLKIAMVAPPTFIDAGETRRDRRRELRLARQRIQFRNRGAGLAGRNEMSRLRLDPARPALIGPEHDVLLTWLIAARQKKSSQELSCPHP